MRLFSAVWIMGLCFCHLATADFVFDNSNFGPSTVSESFEGIAGNGSNLPINNVPFNLPSDIIVVGPTENAGGSFTPFIVNGGFFGLSAASPFIPDGTAYFGQANPGLNDDGIQFQFPENTFRVGAFYGIDTNSTSDAAMEIIAYDIDGNILGSMINIGGSGVNSEWANNFIGFESDVPIHRLHYDGFGAGVLRLDLLQYEVIKVPEPCSAMIVVAVSLTCLSRRRTS